MNRSIRFVIVVVVLCGIAGGVFLVLLRELEHTAEPEKAEPVLVNPVRDLEKGDWVDYRREDGKTERWVAAWVGPFEYGWQTYDVREDGELVSLGEPRKRSMWDMGLGSKWRFTSARPEPIEVAGRMWDSWRIEHDSPMIGRAVSWISAEVPFGLLRRKIIRAPRVTLDGKPPANKEGPPWNFEYLRHGHEE